MVSHGRWSSAQGRTGADEQPTMVLLLDARDRDIACAVLGKVKDSEDLVGSRQDLYLAAYTQRSFKAGCAGLRRRYPESDAQRWPGSQSLQGLKGKDGKEDRDRISPREAQSRCKSRTVLRG